MLKCLCLFRVEMSWF